jgi:hypothetical protein
LTFLTAFFGVAIAGAYLAKWLPRYATALTLLLTAAALVLLVALRIKNIGRDPGLCLTLIIPIFGLLVFLPCFVLPSGYEQHRKLDRSAKIAWGVILAVTVFLLIRIWKVEILQMAFRRPSETPQSRF